MFYFSMFPLCHKEIDVDLHAAKLWNQVQRAVALGPQLVQDLI